MNNVQNNKFNIGDKVFAKVKGFPYWPAIVNNINFETKVPKYNVQFYGTKQIGLNIKENDVCLFSENKSRLCQQYKRNVKYSNFLHALKEAEVSLVKKSPNSTHQSTMNSMLSTDNLSTKSLFNENQSLVVRDNIVSVKDVSVSVIDMPSQPLAISSPMIDTCINSQNLINDNKNPCTNKEINSTVNGIVNLLGPNWIDDDTIWKYYELLNNNVLQNKGMICINPIMCQAVKMLNDYDFVLDGRNIANADYLFLPVNDSRDMEEINTGDMQKVKHKGLGTHWSLLVYEKINKKFYYYDTLKEYNLESAKLLAKKCFVTWKKMRIKR